MYKISLFYKYYTNMNKKNFKKIWIIISLFCLILFPSSISVADDDLDVDWFNIMPQLSDEEIWEVDKAIKDLWTTWGAVRDTYNQKAASELSTSQQIASWIMNWDTIMNYLVFIVQFLSQLWLLVWALFIIYAWYKYMTNVLVWSKAVPATAVKNEIIWVIIVIFSYAIMRVLTSFIWLT